MTASKRWSFWTLALAPLPGPESTAPPATAGGCSTTCTFTRVRGAACSVRAVFSPKSFQIVAFG